MQHPFSSTDTDVFCISENLDSANSIYQVSNVLHYDKMIILSIC